MEQSGQPAPLTEQQQWDDAQRVIREFECACGGALGTAWHKSRGWYVRCGRDPAKPEEEPTHQERRRIRSLGEMYRQGEGLPVSLANQAERRIGPLDLARMDGGTAIAVVMSKFPDALETRGAAAMFVAQCLTVGLNPLLGECCPLAFRSTRRGGAKAATFFPQRDGWAHLASREEPELWLGGPDLRRVADPEEKVRLGFDRDDYVVVARGWQRGIPEARVKVAAFCQWEWDKAKNNPATKDNPQGRNPWGMAEARAERLWYANFFRGAFGKAQRVQSQALTDEGVEVVELEKVIEGEWHEVPPHPSARAVPPKDEGVPPVVEGVPPGPTAGGPPPPTSEGARCSRETLVALQQAGEERTWPINRCIQEAKQLGIDWYRMTEQEGQRLLREWSTAPRGEKPAGGAA